MKAVLQTRYGDVGALRVADLQPPPVGTDKVLVRVCAAGVDPGVWHLMTGKPYLVRAFAGLRRPKVAVRGRDLAGVVERVGAGVTRFAPGDEVFGTSPTGSFAQYVCVNHDRLVHKPSTVDFVAAAAVPVSGCAALHAVRDVGRVREGQRVLVIGAAGGVGSYAVQLAASLGARVTGVCSPSTVDFVRLLGAVDTIDYTRAEVDRDGGVYDVVIDTAGNRPLSTLSRALTPHGTLVIVGGEGGRGALLGGFTRGMLAPLRSILSGQDWRGLVSAESRSDLEDLRGLLEAGVLTPRVDRTFDLEQAGEAITYLRHGHPAGKVVVTHGCQPGRS